MSDTISRQAAIDALEEQLDYLQMLNKDENPTADSKWYGVNWARNTIADLPSAEPEWNNHTVACLLAELFNDTCACNYRDIDEWLPEKCEVIDACPNPVGVACWEQFLKYKAEKIR